MNNKITLVTGLWDINRGDLNEGWSRDFDSHYLKQFKNFLKIPYNLIIFGDKELGEFIEKNKTHDNIQFIERSTEWFKQHFFEDIQRIRNNPKWYNQVGWLKDSTQARLEMYNPLVMSKPFLLNDASILDKFDSTHLFWLDAGITNTVHVGYFTHDMVLDKLDEINKISFVAFPYETNTEIHGFEYSKINDYCGEKVKRVCRGGFFGGPKEEVGGFSSEYYNMMEETLKQGLMGTEESIFTILTYVYEDRYQFYEINGNGLINKFFEDVKNGTHKAKINEGVSNPENNDIPLLNVNNTALYVITFNSPKQLETLIESMERYDNNFVIKPKWYVLDNSTDESTTPKYKDICDKYGFTHIKKDNLGICGGRQFVAEHADENNYDYYFFFEDDMFFYPKKGEVCKNGFNRYAKNLYDISLRITRDNRFDFLKLSFTEFYGDNRTQWSWYNVPQNVRKRVWPEKSKLPRNGLDRNAPKTKITKINSFKGVPFAHGEIYYSNWPQVVSKEGNKKMFLTEKWDRPFEQTWMSYIFQETIKDNIKPGLLLLTPTEHDRFDHYDGKLRKES
jgi:hypothetical protein